MLVCLILNKLALVVTAIKVKVKLIFILVYLWKILNYYKFCLNCRVELIKFKRFSNR